MNEHKKQFLNQMDDVWIDMARRPVIFRAGVEVKPLPPRLWEALRIQLQEEYRRATGERSAILTVTTGDPI